MKTILVTGATGYIGSHTCVALLEDGYNVVGFDNFSNSSKDVLEKIKKITGKEIKFYQADMLDFEKMDSIFKENDIDVVIHFAAFKAVGESTEKPLEYYYNNISGTLELLKAMKKNDCKKIVFSSSATVYGMDNLSPYLENMPISATNPYGYTKVMAEQMLMDICKADASLSAVLLRYFNPIGAHKSGLLGEDPNGIPNNLMPYICKVAMGELACLQVFGNDYPTVDGTGVRDYIHVLDLAQGHKKAVAFALLKTGATPINLGTGKGTSVLELVETFVKTTKKAVPYTIVERRAGDVATCFADTALAKDLLDFSAKYTIEDMCNDSVGYLLANK